MRKIIFIAILVLAAGAIGYMVYNYSMREHEETAEAAAAFSLTHEAILEEFMQDQTAASAKYIGQIVEITGPVMKIDKSEGKVTGVQLSSDESSVVSCTFQNPEDETKLSGTVTIKGEVAGFDFDPESMIPEPSLQLNRSALVTK